MTNDETYMYCFHAFGNEMDCRNTAKLLREAGNHSDALDNENRADAFLDSGWERLEALDGWRPRDVARFRHSAQEQWAKAYPLDVVK